MLNIKKLKIVFLLSLLCSLTTVIFAAERINPYLVGKSSTKPKCPIIVDLMNEKIFRSPLKLSRKFRSEVFFNITNNKFIITRSIASERVEVYSIGADEKKFSEPIFSTKVIGKYSHSKAALSQDYNTLCLVGRYNNETKTKRQLTLTCIKLLDLDNIKTIDLSTHIYSYTSILTISDQLFIAGRRTKTAHDEGSFPDTYLWIDLNAMNIGKVQYPVKEKLFFMGRFNRNELAVSDRKEILRKGLHTLNKVGEYRMELGQIYSELNENKSFFAQIYTVKEKEGYRFEENFIAEVPKDLNKKYRKLFGGEKVGNYDSVIFSQTPLTIH
ncbi:MAG: hypothetical protein [Olavius algarvensis Delta 4 endosymbiont]|nr:MAG: hypothetical protein [Olavius algarvensis Delta 4 endosymbiont]